MSSLSKVRVQLLNEETGVVVKEVDVLTSADAVTFDDGETFQQKLDAGTLKGEKGDAGAKGEKGDPGEAGAKGEKGDPGEAGAKGEKGDPGEAGAKGEKGDPFTIAKTYESVEAMNAGYASDGIAEGSFVIIDTGNVEDVDNAKLYVKGSSAYTYLTDLSGATGLKGEKGDPGEAGAKGEKGDPGEAGAKGEKGDPGDSVKIGSSYETGTSVKLFFKEV